LPEPGIKPRVASLPQPSSRQPAVCALLREQHPVPCLAAKQLSAPGAFPLPKVSAQQEQRQTPKDFDDQVILREAGGKQGRKPYDQQDEEHDAK
jgi:hypothetical protein